MKKFFLIILTIVVLVGGYFIINKMENNKYDYKISQVTEYNYYINMDNGKFGVIDKEGKELIQTQYTKIIIPNPDKDVFICYNNENATTLNSKSEKIFTEYENIAPIKLKSVASTLSYEKSVLIYEKNSKYGLIDYNGQKITDNIYDSIENLEPTEGKFLVKKDTKCGVIDLNGNEIVKPIYDNIESDNYYTKDNEYKKSGFIVSNKQNDGYKYGYINYKGKKILDITCNEIKRVPNEDEKNLLLIVSNNGKYGVIKNSKNIIENEYQSISYDENSKLLIVEKNKKYGVCNLNGKKIIEIENNEIELKGIYIYAKNQNNNKVYDLQGNIVDINFNRCIYETTNSEYRISTILNNNIVYYGIINKNGNTLVEEKYKYLEYLFDNYFIAKEEDGNLGIINNNGKEILEMKYSSLQKIKGKNIIQAIHADSKEVEIYSSKIEKQATLKGINVQIQDDYVVAYNNETKIYLDNDGNIIEDISKLPRESYPDKIGDFIKEQVTIENIYYIKE